MEKLNLRKILKYGLPVILLVIIVGGAMIYWGKYLLRENAVRYHEKVSTAEKEYVEQMYQWIAREDDPRQTYDVHFFISSSVLNQIVTILQGRTIRLGAENTLFIRSLRLDMRTGFPLVLIEGQYKDVKSGLSFGGNAAAVLSFEKQEEGLFFRIKPISFEPSLGVGAVRFALTGMLGGVSELLIQNYAETWPGVRLPFEKLLPVRVPALQQEVIIKIGGKEGDPYIKTEFSFPEISTDMKIVYQGLLFTREGIHLFANLEKPGSEPDHPSQASEQWSKLSVDEKVEALGFGGRDIGARVSKRVFAFAVARVNEMPLENKLIKLRGKSRFGDLVRGNAGPLYYQIWLANAPLANGTMQIDTIKAEISAKGNEIIRYQATGVVQVEGQVGIHVELGKPDKPVVEPQDDKDPIGVVFAPTPAVLDGSFVLNTDDPELPIIAIMMDEQKDVELKARLKIPGFGHVTIHPKFTLPHSRMTRIKLPLELQNRGIVRIGTQEVDYQLEFNHMVCTASNHWLTISSEAALSADEK